MNTKKIIYSINVDDVIGVSEELDIPFEKNDLKFIEEKIGDFMGANWYDAAEFALKELEELKESTLLKK